MLQFLDVLGTTDPTVVQCKSVARYNIFVIHIQADTLIKLQHVFFLFNFIPRRPQDIQNIWTRVDCNITSIRSPMVDPIIQNLQSQNTVAPLVIGSSIIASGMYTIGE